MMMGTSQLCWLQKIHCAGLAGLHWALSELWQPPTSDAAKAARVTASKSRRDKGHNRANYVQRSESDVVKTVHARLSCVSLPLRGGMCEGRGRSDVRTDGNESASENVFSKTEKWRAFHRSHPF